MVKAKQKALLERLGQDVSLSQAETVLLQRKERIANLGIDWDFADNGTAYTFTCPHDNIRIVFTQLRQHKSTGDLSAQVLVEYIDSGNYIQYQTVNLWTAVSRERLSKSLAAKQIGDDIKWEAAIDEICHIVIQAFSQGEPVLQIWGDIENMDAIRPKYLIEPLLYESECNLIFGPGESCKSYLALWLCVMATLPTIGNQYGLIVKAARPLYLDYERSEYTMRQRLSLICKGLEVAPVSIGYRRCHIPFADDIDTIRRIVSEGGYDLVVIDSVGEACAGDINSSEMATRFSAAVHTLPVTSQLIHHTQKADEGRKSPIGSTYFQTAPSNIFEIRKSSTNKNIADVSLSHYKCNLGARLDPLGFRFEFQHDRMLISRQEVTNRPDINSTQSIRQQCIEALAAGPLTLKELADITGIKDDSLKAKLNLHKNDFIKDGDRWSLK